MAIKQLTPEQVRDWTPEQKDRWWLENVYRGDLPQLTIRSALTGFLLGTVLSLTNLYVGAKTGWTLGVGITSVILAFGAFRFMNSIGIAKDISILENNCSQSIATAAGYMTSPLISSMGAYMMYTGKIIPMHQAFPWMISIAILGVLFAFPMKRRFINVEQHPFPEGRAAGVVLDALHHGTGKEGVFQAKLLGVFGFFSATVKILQSEALVTKLKIGFLHFPEYLDGWLYKAGAKPEILGTSLKQLSVRPDTDFVMMAAGGLMGVRTAFSLMVGAVINYLVLAPIMIQRGDILPRMDNGSIMMDLDLGDPVYGFKQITLWALWCGVAMLTTASIVSFFSKPKMIFGAFSGIFSRGKRREVDCVAHIELPMRVFVLGIPLVGGAVVLFGHFFFGVDYILGIIAIPLVFVFSLIGANSTALTSITPTGALGKLTQLTYGLLAPGNVTTNLMTAGITGEVAGNASNLMMDIKPGYMLGAKPRLQAMGHVIGIVAGSLAAIPVFYFAFLRNDPAGLITDEFNMPAVTIWRAVAEALTKGLGELPVSAQWAALAGGIAGILLELVRVFTKGRFPLSAIGMGLAFVINFHTCFSMALGAFLFALVAKLVPNWANPGDKSTIKNQEPICAGIIAGGALMGIAVILLESLISKG